MLLLNGPSSAITKLQHCKLKPDKTKLQILLICKVLILVQLSDFSFSVYISSRELFSPSQKYQLLVYHADSLFHDKEYRNAVSKYTMALQQKKALSKTSKVRPSTGNAASTPQSQVIKS